MAERFEPSKIHYPDSLNDLLSLAHSKPEAVIFSGGTWLLRNQAKPRFRLPETIISLHTVEELRRIGRTENRIDFGAAASLEQILKTCGRSLPQLFTETLEGLVPPGLRGLATLGGNVCVPERSMTSHATLHILDAQLEFRRLTGARWLPVTGVRSQEGKLLIEPGDVLTRIRLPLAPWNVQYFRRLGTNPFAFSQDSLVFAAVARTGRGIVGDLRFAIASHQPCIYRNRDLETSVIGRRLPLNPKDVSAFIGLLEEDFGAKNLDFTALQRERILLLVQSFIENLPKE